MSINFISLKKIYIHDGVFNTDDAISLAMLEIINPIIEVERTSTVNNTCPNSLYLGVGNGQYSFARLKDKKDYYGNPYCLSSMVFESAIDGLLAKAHIKNIQKAKALFYEQHISKIAIGTRSGFEKVSFFGENGILLEMNCLAYEEYYGITNYDQQFLMAVDVSKIIIENWLRQIKEDADLRIVEDKIWNEAEENSKDGIYVLERHIPWQYQVKKHPNTTAKIIIFKSNRGGYNVVTRSTEKLKIQDSPFLSFIHPSKYMGVADSLDNAILAAKQSLKASAMPARS